MTDSKTVVEPPPDLRGTFPPLDRLIECFATATTEVTGPLFRAAYVSESVLPTKIRKVYRFGPPEALLLPDGQKPFWWLYAAPLAETAIWEARFCLNDVTQAGTYYFDESAVKQGIVAELRFPRTLRLWDLNGSAASRLGIYDQLSSPDYEWCQWFGHYMDLAILATDEAIRPDGFVYPSRRHRGHAAIAISSRALLALRDGVIRTDTPFAEHADYGRMLRDKLRIGQPASDAPIEGR